MKYNSIEKYNNLWELFTDSSEKYKNRTLFNFYRGYRHVLLSYEETYEEVKKIASFLIKKDFKKGDKLIIYLPPRGEWLEILFASILLGVIVIPIDMESPIEMIDQIIDETKPKGVFCLKSKLLNTSKKIQNIFLIENLEEFIHDIEPIKLRNYAKDISEDDIYQILYTSGTTGKPKGVIITHKNTCYNIYNGLLIFPTNYQFNVLQILPFSHVYALILGIGVIMLGGQMNFVPKLNAAEVKTALNQNIIYGLPSIPLVLNTLKSGIEKKFQKIHLIFLLNFLQKVSSVIKVRKIRRIMFFFIHKQLGGNLQIIVSAGAYLSPETFKWWENLGITVLKGYGLTETGPILSLEDKNRPDPYSIGIPLPNQKLKIASDGEILVKGLHITQGYFRNEEKTKESFDEDGWYKTGDLGYIKEGKLYYSGRKKDMIVLPNGMKVHPEDIETKLNTMPGIIESCILGIDRGNGEEVFAVIISEKDNTVIKEIIKKINSQLAVNQYIKDFYLFKEKDFPRTHTRKVKRNVLKQKIEQELNLQKSSNKSINNKFEEKESKNSTVLTLKQILADITQKNIVEIKDDSNLVNDLGLDSLGRSDLLASIEQSFSKVIQEKNINSTTNFIDLLNLLTDAPLNTAIQVKKPGTFYSKLIFKLFKNYIVFPIIWFVSFFFLKIKVTGKIPESGQYLIVMNHRSNIDPIVLQMILGKNFRSKTYYTADGTLWHKLPRSAVRGLVQILFTPLFTVRGDHAAAETMQKVAFYINKGFNIAYYPEGRIIYNRENFNDFKPGAAKIIKEFKIDLLEIKVKGLEIVKKGKILPKIGRNPIEIVINTKKINPYLSINEITEILKKDFEGF